MTEQEDKEKRVKQFLDLTKELTWGRLKINIGVSSRAGKTLDIVLGTATIVSVSFLTIFHL